MTALPTILLAVSAVMTLFTAHAAFADSGSASCSPETIGVDTTLADNSAGALLGSAIGQSFVATDTLITSISAWWWQPRGWPDDITPAMKLWVFRVHSDPVYPITDPQGTLFEGSVIRARSNPDTSDYRLVRMQYRFDPPFQLPGPGTYSFFFQDPCAFPFDLWIHLSGDVYQGGRLWLTGHNNFVPGCRQRSGYIYSPPAADLIFEVQFCGRTVTPIKRSTWGRLKVIYR